MVHRSSRAQSNQSTFQAGVIAVGAAAQRMRGSREEEEDEQGSWGQTVGKALVPQVGHMDLTQKREKHPEVGAM